MISGKNDLPGFFYIKKQRPWQALLLEKGGWSMKKLSLWEHPAGVSGGVPPGRRIQGPGIRSCLGHH